MDVYTFGIGKDADHQLLSDVAGKSTFSSVPDGQNVTSPRRRDGAGEEEPPQPQHEDGAARHVRAPRLHHQGEAPRPGLQRRRRRRRICSYVHPPTPTLPNQLYCCASSPLLAVVAGGTTLSTPLLSSPLLVQVPSHKSHAHPARGCMTVSSIYRGGRRHSGENEHVVLPRIDDVARAWMASGHP